MASFTFLVRFFVFIVIDQSAVFSSEKQLVDPDSPKSPCRIIIIPLGHFGMTRSASEIVGLLEKVERECPGAMKGMINFVSTMKEVEQSYKYEIGNSQSCIENICREVLIKRFKWGTLHVSDEQYQWKSLQALEAKNNKYTYLPLALEIQALVDEKLAAPYLNLDVDLTEFKEKLDVELNRCKIILEEIETEKTYLERMSESIPISPLGDPNSFRCNDLG